MRVDRLDHEFVELMPSPIREGILYISIEFGVGVHLCACGCGEKVVTPLSPAEWRMIYDGENVTLRPSIGNWSFSCESHYLVTENRIEWLPAFSKEKIALVRQQDAVAANRYYDENQGSEGHTTEISPRSMWRRALDRLRP